MATLEIIIIVIGVTLLFFFFKQFGFTGGRGLIFAISGLVLAVFGISIFNNYRRNKLLEQFKEREKELENQEKKLDELNKALELSDQQVFEAEAALKSEKGKHAKKIRETEAEKAKDFKEAKQRINDMSISELMESF